ncbi:MAG TPA: hypothetical protein GX398_07610 [Candidatus Cloacimonetes bacterium]|jgi:acyl-CoA synthetase (AMP-forming)/AMP-acid ligase II|nr:hypothetical protein [Candidatus Cloacimonadota bacterium]
MKNETLPIIILVLILLSQIYLCYLGSALLKQNKKVEVPEESVPIEAFERFITEQPSMWIAKTELVGWSINGDECNVVIKKYYHNGDESSENVYFRRIRTYSGPKWFYTGDYSLVPGAD